MHCSCIFFESLDPSMMKPYHKCDQRRLRRACAFVQSRQGLAAGEPVLLCNLVRVSLLTNSKF